jgi:hypothetical protein
MASGSQWSRPDATSGYGTFRVHQDICRLDILVNQASLMHLAERRRQRNRDVQEMRRVERPAKQPIERRTPGILKHQRYAAVAVCQRDRSCRPVSFKFALERVFVFKPLDTTERRFVSRNEQDRRQPDAGAPEERDVSLPQRRECVARDPVHEGRLTGGLVQYID